MHPEPVLDKPLEHAAEVDALEPETLESEDAGAEKPLDRSVRLNAIDVHVGSRIRLLRTLRGMSQESMGEALGVAFQQIQKYEHGTNRVSASRLFDIARLLNVGVGYFYDGMASDRAYERVTARRPEKPLADRHEARLPQDPLAALMGQRETLALIGAFYRIQDPTMRQKMLDLIQAMTPAQKTAQTDQGASR